MTTFSLTANHNRAFPLLVSRTGKVEIFVEAENPVGILLLDDNQFARFRAAQTYSALMTHAAAPEHRQVVTLPYVAQWHLVIVNWAGKDVAVHVDAKS